jgi:RNA polymerase sigma factor (sigma-70 family)
LFGAVGCRARRPSCRGASPSDHLRASVAGDGMVAPSACAANGLKGPVARTADSGRSAHRERARASEPRHTWDLESPRDTAARGGGVVAAVARPAWFALPFSAAPAARPMSLRGPGATKAEPRAPVAAAIVALVPLAAAGDKAAFTRLVETFHADMARLAYFVCGGNRELAEDAVQSAWAIAWSRLGTLRDHDRIRPWLLSVTANEARQMLRQQRQMVAVHLEFAEERLAGPDPYASAAALDMGKVLARLKPEERTLVGLRYAAGLDSAEIGAVLGMSASGVRSRLDRLLDRLRAELEHE